MKKVLVQLFVLAISLMVLQPALAKKKHKQHPTGIVISSVNAVDKTLTMKIKDNSQSLAYKAPLGTTITIDGQSASLAQIQPGMKVITYTEADEHVLAQLDVDSAKK